MKKNKNKNETNLVITFWVVKALHVIVKEVITIIYIKENEILPPTEYFGLFSTFYVYSGNTHNFYHK